MATLSGVAGNPWFQVSGFRFQVCVSTQRAGGTSSLLSFPFIALAGLGVQHSPQEHFFDDGDTVTFPWHIFQCVPILKYTIHSFIHLFKER